MMFWYASVRECIVPDLLLPGTMMVNHCTLIKTFAS
jgi:hypothetical protein